MKKIISKLFFKWFAWKFKKLDSEIEKLSANGQKDIHEEIAEYINDEVDFLVTYLEDELEARWEIINDCVADKQQEEIDEAENEAWEADQKAEIAKTGI